MCTPVLREIKRVNPACEITFVAQNPELFAGNPHIDRLEKMVPGVNDFGIWLGYDHVRPPPRRIISMMAECVGLRLDANQLDGPTLGEGNADLLEEIAALPRPRVVIQPIASKWTPVKQWPEERWIRLVGELVKRYWVIEIGTESFLPAGEFGPGFRSLVGKTTLMEMASVIALADVFVGPPSAGMHLANAARVPSVIIFGGHEEPAGLNYPRTTAFYREVECAPCWLHNRPCPHDLKCMKLISPEEVFEAVAAFVDRREGKGGGKYVG